MHEPMSKIMNEGVPYQVMRDHDLEPELQMIIRQSTHRDPTRRFPAAKEMVERIEDFLRRSGTYVSPSDMANFLVQGVSLT